ncbi:metallophosphoesterase family protein [Aliikangiella coralliicola]|uniref:Metallophosphoesterase n=1 Tax=Aliikangiella coralliicola TaxID=2592383 RepID=A0A545U947_9GAMM|nr:metallophosphoesterase family protein [Aliikangiella coralliicola]TQV85985.1 metallophosphoesterase [Aliikangiella coralliicola]
MRVFVVSDIHVDYSENKQWLVDISNEDYVDDILIVAGDITDDLKLLDQCFRALTKKFLKVLFVPGNHELWVSRDTTSHSLEKFELITQVAADNDVGTQPYHNETLSIVPLLGWYDFSFAPLTEQLEKIWMDFRACVWPDNLRPADVTEYFVAKNEAYLQITNQTVISFSHFLPRIDLMPIYIPQAYRYVYPALGSVLLEKQIRKLKPDIHVYGHSHVNRRVTLEGIKYVNNAFGYPSEDSISIKNLLCIYEH